MTELGTIGTSSAKIGSDLAELLTTPGLKQAELETKLGGLIDRQQQGLESAQALDVPGPLRPATDHAAEALQLRVSGMQGLLDTFVATKGDDSDNATAAGEKLAARRGSSTRATSSGASCSRFPPRRRSRTRGSVTSRRRPRCSSRRSSCTRRGP